MHGVFEHQMTIASSEPLYVAVNVIELGPSDASFLLYDTYILHEEWCLLGCYAVKTSNLTYILQFVRNPKA
jgi:hypothetical protein